MLTTFKGVASYIDPARGRERSGHVLEPSRRLTVRERRVYQRRHAQSCQVDAGRALVDAAANVTVNVVEPNTMFGDRIDQLDLRIGKILRFGRTRTNLNLDIVNALNSNDNLAYSATFGATWPAPTSVLTARLFRLSAQFDF